MRIIFQRNIRPYRILQPQQLVIKSWKMSIPKHWFPQIYPSITSPNTMMIWDLIHFQVHTHNINLERIALNQFPCQNHLKPWLICQRKKGTDLLHLTTCKTQILIGRLILKVQQKKLINFSFSFEREFDEERRIDCSQPSPLHNLSRSNHLLDYPPGLEPSSLYSHWNEDPCLRNPRFISNDALITSSVENFGSLHLRDSLDAKSARELASSYNICSYTPLQKEFAVNDSNSNSHTSNGLFEQAFSRNSSFFTNSNLLKQKSLHLGNDLPNSTSSALPPTIPNASYYHDSKSKV